MEINTWCSFSSDSSMWPVQDSWRFRETISLDVSADYLCCWKTSKIMDCHLTDVHIVSVILETETYTKKKIGSHSNLTSWHLTVYLWGFCDDENPWNAITRQKSSFLCLTTDVNTVLNYAVSNNLPGENSFAYSSRSLIAEGRRLSVSNAGPFGNESDPDHKQANLDGFMCGLNAFSFVNISRTISQNLNATDPSFNCLYFQFCSIVCVFFCCHASFDEVLISLCRSFSMIGKVRALWKLAINELPNQFA